MPARRSRGKSSRVLLKVGLSLLVAVAIAGLVHVLVPPSGAAQQSAPMEPTYSIDPAAVALTTTDVGTTFSLVNEGGLGPSQRSAPGHPAPYQQQFFGGWARNYMIQSALVPPGRTELTNYAVQIGIYPSDPPTIMGPFVIEHHGLFEVSDFEESYHQAGAAHPDYLCCDAGSTANYTANYDNWRPYPIHLGDEANAWGGIRRTPANRDDYEEQTFRIRWRHGPIVSTIFTRGAHDLTLDSALGFAHIVDARIASAMRQAAKGVSHAADPHVLAPPDSSCLALCDSHRRTGRRIDWT